MNKTSSSAVFGSRARAFRRAARALVFPVAAKEFHVFSRANCNCSHRILRRHGIDSRLLGNQIFKSAKQASPACKDNSPVGNIRRKLGGRFLQYAVNGVDNLCRRLLESLFCLLRGNLYRLDRKSVV